MTTHDTHIEQPRFPAPAPPRSRTLEALQVLENWRNAGAATAAVSGAAVPVATSAHTAYRVSAGCALIVAALLALFAHAIREHKLSVLVIHAEFAHVPAVARKRRRMVTPRRRLRLARWLRETAAAAGPPARFDVCPVLRERVAYVRSELHEIASLVEHNPDPDPGSVALIRELLTAGAGPLYNPNVPAIDLHVTLARVRAGLIDPDRENHNAVIE